MRAYIENKSGTYPAWDTKNKIKSHFRRLVGRGKSLADARKKYNRYGACLICNGEEFKGLR